MCVGSAGRFIYDFYYKLEKNYTKNTCYIRKYNIFKGKFARTFKVRDTHLWFIRILRILFTYCSTRMWLMTISMNQVTSGLQGCGKLFPNTKRKLCSF